MLAAKALHSILCHDELEHAGERTQGRLRKLLQLAHPSSAADRGTAGVYAQEAFRLLQCIALAGAQHAADVEMISYLRDLAVCYVCECGRIAPAMSPAALLAFKQLRDAVRDAMTAECMALFEDFEAHNPVFARYAGGLRIGGQS